MATFYTDSNQRVAAPMMYLREHLPTSYTETHVLPNTMMLYMNSGSYSDTLGGNSQQPSSCIDIPPVGGIESNFSGSRITEHDFNGRDQEMLVMNPSSILQNGGQGLSLSLGTQIPGGFQMPSPTPYRNSNMGLVSFLSPNPSISEEGGGSRNGPLRNEHSRNVDFVSTGFNQDSGMQGFTRSIPNSRYLKAAQQLLDEVVNVRKALKQADEGKDQSRDNEGRAKSSEDGDGGAKNDTDSSAKDSAGKELSHSEKQELQNRLTKLLAMLDEVDKRYRQYYHQMQYVVSSFDAVAGPGAAKPYTALALQRISRHFRCLRDAITGQIQASRKSLGEQDSSGNNGGVGITRLRYVDQQLRQQRALQQLGMMQPHAWRPQRGLPESSVSILRAWLFEHFLHPYPKDSDKIMLARQTGLTRSQVSNWFINARVRLWKPMVEEMYKEEIGDPEMDSNSSSENAIKASNRGDIGSSEDRGDDIMQKSSSSVEKLTDPKSNHVPDMDMVGSTGAASFLAVTRDVEPEYNVKLRGDQRPGMNDACLFADNNNNNNTRFMSDAETAFHMSELGRFGNGTGVSLTLGLQHFEGGALPFSGSMHHEFVAIRGDEFYGTMGGSSVGSEAGEFDVNNSSTQHHRLGPGQQLLHDFVA